MITRRVVGVLIALALLFSGVATAAGTGTGKVLPGWFTYPGGIVFFYLDGPNQGHVNSPCTIAHRWAIDTSTLDGKNAFAVLMLAFSQDRTVTVTGLDSVACIYSNTEAAVIVAIN